MLVSRKQAAEALVANPPGYCQLLATATPKDLIKHGRKSEKFFFSLRLWGIAWLRRNGGGRSIH